MCQQQHLLVCQQQLLLVCKILNQNACQKNLGLFNPQKSNKNGGEIAHSPRNNLTLKSKAEIIEQSKKIGFSQKRAAEKYGVSQSCISKI